MKKTMKQFAVAIMALCLTFANIIPAAADTTTANSTAPAKETVTADAQSTAKYMMDNAISGNVYSLMSDTSNFYGTSRILFLSIRSGYDCTANITLYTTALNDLLDADGKLTVTNLYGYANDNLGCQAYAILTLKAAGLNPASFNGKNLISGLSKMLEGKTVVDFSKVDDTTTSINPYFLGVLYTTISTYAKDINNSASALTNIRTGLDSFYVKNATDGTGIDNYGVNVDNNAYVLTGFASLYAETSTDTAFKNIIDTSLAYAKSDRYDSATGGSKYYYEYDGTVYLYTSSNSTALAPAFYGTFGDTAMAATSYNALKTYSFGSNGAYASQPGGTTADSYTIPDALYGLVSYQYVLYGYNNVFDTTKTIDFTKKEEVTQATTEAATETTTPAATEASSATIAASTAESDQTDSTVETNDHQMTGVYAAILMTAIMGLGYCAVAGKKNVNK